MIVPIECVLAVVVVGLVIHSYILSRRLDKEKNFLEYKINTNEAYFDKKILSVEHDVSILRIKK